MKRILSIILLCPFTLNAMEKNTATPSSVDTYYEVKIDVSFSDTAITPQTIRAQYSSDGQRLHDDNPQSVSIPFRSGSSANVELYCASLPDQITLASTITNPSEKPWPLSHLFPHQWKWTSKLKAGEKDQLIVRSDPKIVMTMAAYIDTKSKE